MEQAPSPALLATAWALRVDRTTAEVTGAFDEAGIPSVLLKGPVLQRWLYDDGAVRSYTDSDLLVPPDRATEVATILGRLAFEDCSLAGIANDRPLHALTFVRPADGAHVDVHTTLIGATVPAAEAWNVIVARSEEARIGGRAVRVPTRPVLAMHAALHAAQHGALEGKPLEDLRRAATRLDAGDWEDALEVAVALGAIAPFAAGLALVPEASDVIRHLRLEGVEDDPYVRLRATTAPHLSTGFAWLDNLGSAGEKLRFIGSKMFPPPRFMRAWTPLARRGLWGLALSYPWRLVWVAWHVPSGLRAWRKAKR